MTVPIGSFGSDTVPLAGASGRLRFSGAGCADETARRDGVFHLPEPDREPVPAPARCALVWRGRHWAEIDAATGRVLARGVAG